MGVPDESERGRRGTTESAARGTEDVDGQDGKMDMGVEAQGDGTDRRSTSGEGQPGEEAVTSVATMETATGKKERRVRKERVKLEEPSAANEDVDLQENKMDDRRRDRTRENRRAPPQAVGSSATGAEQWGQSLKEVQVQLERLAAAQEDMQKTLSMLAAGGNVTAPGHSPAGINVALATVSAEKEKKGTKFNDRLTTQSKMPQEEELAQNGGSIPEEDEFNEVPKKTTIQTQKTFGCKDRCSNAERAMAAALAEKTETEELRSVFVEADREMKEVAEYKAKTYMQRFQTMTVEERDQMVDLAMAIIIILNMLVIGLSLDMEGSVVFLCIDICLTLFFIGEIVTKVALHGVKGHFCPEGFVLKVMCWTDATIVAIDIMQLSVQLATWGVAETGSSVRTSVLRVFRLARLARFIRLLRMEAFQDLMMMVTGLLVGMPTLAWAIVLLLIIFYVLALASRLALGSGGPMEIRQEFESVDRAVFAVFRCSFGDCSTAGGVSLLGLVIEHYGAIVGVLGCLVIFFVTIGMFNVISAIFVQGTMTAWFACEEKHKKDRLNDFTHFSVQMRKLLVQAFEYSQEEKSDDVFCIDSVDEWKEMEIMTADFRKACENDEIVRDALRELDIHEGDLPVLGDILDPQNDLKLTMMEILQGIIRLRGDPRRSDIVTIDLMVRDIQKSVGKLLDRLGHA